MKILQRGYYLTTGIANGAWDISKPLASSRLISHPFYEVIYLKSEYLNQLSSHPLLSNSRLFFSYACQGIYYGIPLAIKGTSLIRLFHQKDWKAVETIETTYKTVLISLLILSTVYKLQKASFECNPIEITHAAGLFLGGFLEALTSCQVINEQSGRSILNKLWWLGIALSFVEGQGVAGGLSLLVNRLISNFLYETYAILLEFPIYSAQVIYLIIAFKRNILTIHPVLENLGNFDLNADRNREIWKDTFLQAVDKAQNKLSEAQHAQLTTLITECFDQKVVDKALALCKVKTFQDLCQRIATHPFATDYQEVYNTILALPEGGAFKQAFDSIAVKAPDLFLFLYVFEATEKAQAICNKLIPDEQDKIAESNPEMMNYFLAHLTYDYAFGEKSNEEIPPIFSKATYDNLVQLRADSTNSESIQWIKDNLLSSFANYSKHSEKIPKEYQEFVNQFRSSFQKEIKDGIIITKAWPRLIDQDGSLIIKTSVPG